MENKRERSSNFTRSECESLVSLIEKYKDTLECKKTDATTWKEKEATWLRVANEFNAVHVTCRTAKVLRAKYDNLKKMAKKDDAQAKTEAMRIGGGPPVYKKPDELLERIKALICLSTSSLPPRYDSDSRYACVVEEEPVEVKCEVPVSEDTVVIDFHNTSSSTTMWDGWNPSILKDPLHAASLRVPDAADGGETVGVETTPDPGSPSEPCAGPSHAISTEEQRQTRNRKRPRTVYTTNETRGLYNELALDKKQLVATQKKLLELEQLKINEEREYKREEHNKRMKQMDEEREFKREQQEFAREQQEFAREQQEFAREEHKKRVLLLDLEIAKMA